jgi:hypothetical protein
VVGLPTFPVPIHNDGHSTGDSPKPKHIAGLEPVRVPPQWRGAGLLEQLILERLPLPH